MKGVTLYENESKTKLTASVDAQMCEHKFDSATFIAFIASSEFRTYDLLDENIRLLEQEVSIDSPNQQGGPIEKVIGEIREIHITITIAEDKMSASLTLDAHPNAPEPDINHIIALARKQGILVGLSRKRILHLIKQCKELKTSTVLNGTIAKGLPARDGKQSRVKPLVPNAFERLLRPQDKGNDKVDMRNLGDIICVLPEQAVAKRIAPTMGRLGKTVAGKDIIAIPGKVLEIKLGNNTQISAKNENLILASVSGQPKFENGCMSIEDAFIAKGVNVSTGNIKYDGAVIVNGDVTENMKIIAKGDVTINGFVESAFIHSEGDIIITEGASGKMHDEDCQIIADGSIYIQHAQGLDIVAGKDLNVAKQLAYSRVKVVGSVTVGDVQNPMGNLFASTVHCGKTIVAGSIGAISGSALMLDFSEEYNAICTQLTSLSSLYNQLEANNSIHEDKIVGIDSQKLSPVLQAKLQKIQTEIDDERILLQWLQDAQLELQNRKNAYEQNARVIANKELLPGVTIKLNNKVWKGEKEYQRSNILFNAGNWVYEPLV